MPRMAAAAIETTVLFDEEPGDILDVAFLRTLPLRLKPM
jgi:hypothetical protein